MWFGLGNLKAVPASDLALAEVGIGVEVGQLYEVEIFAAISLNALLIKSGILEDP